MDGYDALQWVFIFLMTIATIIFTSYVVRYTQIFKNQKEPYSFICFALVFLSLITKVVFRIIALIGIEIQGYNFYDYA